MTESDQINYHSFAPDFTKRPDLEHLHKSLNHKRKQQYLDILYPGRSSISKTATRVLLLQKPVKNSDLNAYVSLWADRNEKVYLLKVLDTLAKSGCKIKVKFPSPNSRTISYTYRRRNPRSRAKYRRSALIQHPDAIITVVSIGKLSEARKLKFDIKKKYDDRKQHLLKQKELWLRLGKEADQASKDRQKQLGLEWTKIIEHQKEHQMYVIPKLIAEDLMLSNEAKILLSKLKKEWLGFTNE